MQSQRTAYHLGFGTLGRLIERKVGKSWEDLVAQHITKPLGMKDTDVDERLTADQKKRRAWPNGSESGTWLFGSFPVDNPAGALYSTGADMLKYLEAMMGKSGVASLDSAVALAVKPSFTGHGANKGMGFSWGHGSLLETGCAEVVSKDGATPGFRTWMGFVPSDGTGVVVMANWNNDDATEPTTQIGEQILRALH